VKRAPTIFCSQRVSYSPPRVIWRNLFYTFVLVATVSCQNADGQRSSTTGCPRVEINPQLSHVLYWGYTGPRERKPNEGIPFSDVGPPVWVAPDKILVLTGTLINGVSIRGIFEVIIDPRSRQFQGFNAFHFPYFIDALKCDFERDRIMIVYRDDAGSVAASVVLRDGWTIVDEELVGRDWNPLGVLNWPKHEGVVFYGGDNAARQWGFYWRRKSGYGVTVDSLLCPAILPTHAARNFSIDVDGGALYFGMMTDYGETTFYRLQIPPQDETPEPIATRNGDNVSVVCHPSDPSLLLLSYQFGGDSRHLPSGYIELVSKDGSNVKNLNIRTYGSLCQFTRIGNLSWAPNGRDFAFTEGAFGGEGDIFPYELWIYVDVIQ
jgi:hypothetical protein